ncbi:MAG: hypothetical protein HYR70_10715 [Chloroflexi bacterium]|nr:hypothetical protein [Chloroflexota bacterium]MBI3340013.1 hypothetical protein [Chloroflexota bacterium]
MAKVKLNPVLEQIRGQVGDLVFKHYGDEMVVGRKPDRSGIQPTEAQLEHQERFRQAVLYGRLVMADPQKKAGYEQAARAKGKPLFSLTIADFFNAPVVDEVDLSAYAGAVGDPIVVRAHDDFQVTRLRVSISNTNGEAIESGDAEETPARSGRWVYAATTIVPAGTNVRIAVTVSDQPGGTGEATAEKSL